MKNRRVPAWLILALLPAASLRAQPVKVVTSNMILADLVRQVGGADVDVTSLARASADLHDFEPQASDVRLLADADVVVVNGLGLEPWIDKLVRNSGFHGQLVVASRGVDVIGDARVVAGSKDYREVDPHAWHDPAATRTYVHNIREALARAAPASSEYFAQRERDFDVQLEKLDGWARREIATILRERRKIVTSHDSLAYLGRAYGIDVISVTGISASAEASAKRVAEVIDMIRKSGVTAVFIDSADNPGLMREIATDAGVRLGGRLITDGLGEPGSGADTYLGMMSHNLRRILDSLR